MSGGEIDVRLHWQEYAYFSVYESRLCRGEHEFPRREREKENERDLFENSAVAQEGAEGLAGVGFLLALSEALGQGLPPSCGGCDGSLDRGLNLCKSHERCKVSGPRRVSVYNPLNQFKFPRS